MGRDATKKYVERKIIAESMGRCMNPTCQEELFRGPGDIIERAHIIPYYDTKDNSYENLVVLCPNCHTDFDKIKHSLLKKLKSGKRYEKMSWKRSLQKSFLVLQI
ncbi:HNH endonuclease [Lacrimispora sp. NSJ-141]|uniref:HNH endonuclease n=1 Tax=Lientehia hominis TaxID=2897778 RepID=A0AAP2RLB1_9FIRM|nr:HNH endonuclease signature motif containing protein [Lientehia hominis]MCD2492968.1 HNH endonuclease [Lientehia hominis]